ncbi:MAG: Uma2 family endonuclease [Pseudomonadota bacterium]|nr:Uma2 family endonuclease [Pseudomonadota bacterium]
MIINKLTYEPGKVFPECAIKTEDSVKVADIVWISPTRYQRLKAEFVYPLAAEICVEMLSSSNTLDEMRRKIALYLQAGAEEVWTCNEHGQLQFYNQNGELEHSLLITAFPQKITVE